MCVVVGLEGHELTSFDQELLSNRLVTGVILFSRNYHDPKQLLSLTRAVKAERPDLCIAIDQEGGRVQRLSGEPFTTLPAFRQLGEYRLVDNQAALDLAYAVGYVMAYELSQFQIDFSFTPVLDLDYGLSAVIGNRSFDCDPDVVIELAGALCRGIKAVGMMTVGKHFPGHGGVRADTHFRRAVDPREMIEIQHDIKPFQTLINDGLLSAVMPSHVIYEKIDPEPAGFSCYWLQNVLRRKLNFQGLVFSDCLTMQAAQMEGGLTAAAIRSFTAGCDFILICNELDKIPSVLVELKNHGILPKPFSLSKLKTDEGLYHDAQKRVLEFNNACATGSVF